VWASTASALCTNEAQGLRSQRTATAETAGGFLRSRLVEHNLLLTITERLRRVDRPGPGEPPLLGWWADGPGRGGRSAAPRDSCSR
jgi:hypothetical protein